MATKLFICSFNGGRGIGGAADTIIRRTQRTGLVAGRWSWVAPGLRKYYCRCFVCFTRLFTQWAIHGQVWKVSHNFLIVYRYSPCRHKRLIRVVWQLLLESIIPACIREATSTYLEPFVVIPVCRRRTAYYKWDRHLLLTQCCILHHHTTSSFTNE